MENLIILGGGESGTGAAILGHKLGMDVFLSDTGTLAPRYAEMLEQAGIPFEQGHPHTMERVLAASLIVKSPGIPDSAPVITAAKQKGIPVISEIELAARHTSSRLICITGSNGKTTTTTLLHHILSSAGLDASMAGNVGQSLALQVASEPHAIYVVELSSFQLDGCSTLHPDISILLNITPDHLDRYDHRMELYAASKISVTNGQTPADTFIYWAEDPWTLRMLPQAPGHPSPLPFAEKKMPGLGGWLEAGSMHISTPEGTWSMPREEISIKGLHNAYNAMAASIAATRLGVKPDAIRAALRSFKAVEHRLEHVAEIQGVEWINDSKATNVASTYYALESMTRPTVLILGGTDKGNDYEDILPFVKQKVKHIVAMGHDNRKITDFCARHAIPCTDTHSLPECIAACREVSRSGDTVLLSPACASFDLFKSYIDRGRKFKTEVLNLQKEKD